MLIFLMGQGPLLFLKFPYKQADCLLHHLPFQRDLYVLISFLVDIFQKSPQQINWIWSPEVSWIKYYDKKSFLSETPLSTWICSDNMKWNKTVPTVVSVDLLFPVIHCGQIYARFNLWVVHLTLPPFIARLICTSDIFFLPFEELTPRRISN